MFYLLLLATIYFPFIAYSMEVTKAIVPNKELALCIIPKNIHNCVNDPYEAGELIRNMSCINKNLYAGLDKHRNNPIVTREMVNNLARTCVYFDFSESPFKSVKIPYSGIDIAKNLKTAGAKTYCSYSEELLCNNDIDAKDIEKLIKEGADVNYTRSDRSYGDYHVFYSKKYLYNSPLAHWAESNTHQSLENMQMLLKSGANPNDTYQIKAKRYVSAPLIYAIVNQDINKVKLLLQHNAHFDYGHWSCAIDRANKKIFHLLIGYSNKNNLNDGLIACLYKIDSLPTIQMLLDAGADADVALKDMTKAAQRSGISLFFNTDLLKLLCKYGAFCSPALDMIYEYREKIAHDPNERKKCEKIIKILETNKPRYWYPITSALHWEL